MTGLGFDHPLALLLLPLAALPLLASPLRSSAVPSSAVAPDDPLSSAIGCTLRVLGALAVFGLVFGLAGLHRRDQVVERQGAGANIVLLIDRSSSMDSTFANRSPDGREESKSVAAKRLLTDFAARRPADRVAVAAFSTAPMPVVPMTDRHDAVRAAIAAIDRPGLAHTDVGRGLVLAFSMFDAASSETSRALVLVSDGAAVIDRRVQDALRDAARRSPVKLYWLFLRTQGSKGITDRPAPGESDSPQVYPERHLDIFFKTLGLPYRAFEARSAGEVSAAIREIDQLEQRPTTYRETLPRQDLDWICYLAAAVALAGLLGAKLMERRFEASEPLRVRGGRPDGVLTSSEGGEVGRQGRARGLRGLRKARLPFTRSVSPRDLSPPGRGEGRRGAEAAS